MCIKLSEVNFRPVRIRLKKTFRIAYAEEIESTNVIVELVDKKGNVGYGEISPSQTILGTDVDQVLKYLKIARKILKEHDITIMNLNKILMKSGIIAGNVIAGLDIALHDLTCKILEIPLWKFLGAERSILVTDYTISLGGVDEMVQEGVEYFRKGFKILKVKLGEDPERDLDRVKKIVENIPDVKLRVDVNQGWRDLKQVLRVVRELEKLNVEVIEQPFPKTWLREHKILRERTLIPIVLDESVMNIDDLLNVVAHEACDGINIKLMKCGGVNTAVQMCTLAEKLRLKVMIGCMLETKISITAAACVAAAFNVDYVDLDSPLMIQEVEGITIQGGIEYDGCMIKLPDKPGLGVEVRYQ